MFELRACIAAEGIVLHRQCFGFLLQFVEPPGEVVVRRGQLSYLYKRPYPVYGYFGGARRIQDGCPMIAPCSVKAQGA